MIISTCSELSQIGLNKLFQVKSKRIYQAIRSKNPECHCANDGSTGCELWDRAKYKVLDRIEDCSEACQPSGNNSGGFLWYKLVTYRIFL